VLIITIRVGPCGAVARNRCSWICTSCVGICAGCLRVRVRVGTIRIRPRRRWMLSCLRRIVRHKVVLSDLLILIPKRVDCRRRSTSRARASCLFAFVFLATHNPALASTSETCSRVYISRLISSSFLPVDASKLLARSNNSRSFCHSADTTPL
jgi:hypothetical protein